MFDIVMWVLALFAFLILFPLAIDGIIEGVDYIYVKICRLFKQD